MRVRTRKAICYVLIILTLTIPSALRSEDTGSDCTGFSHPNIEIVDVKKFKRILSHLLFNEFLSGKKVGFFNKLAWKKRIKNDIDTLIPPDRLSPMLAYRYAELLSFIIQIKDVNQVALHKKMITQMREWSDTPDLMTLDEAFVDGIHDLTLLSRWNRRIRLLEREGQSIRVRFLDLREWVEWKIREVEEEEGRSLSVDEKNSLMVTHFNSLSEFRPEMKEMLKPIREFDLDDPSKLEEAMIKMNPNHEEATRAAFKDKAYLDILEKLNGAKNML